MTTSIKNRTTIFIDGNNLYKTLMKMGFRLKPNEHMKLIDFIHSGFKTIHNLDLDIKSVFYYNSVPSIKDGEEMYNKHMKFINHLNNLPKWEAITRKLQRSSNEEIIEEKNAIIEKLKLCKNCKLIAIKNCSECLGSIKKREKGIDVQIAIDMVKCAYKDEFDYCTWFLGTLILYQRWN